MHSCYICAMGKIKQLTLKKERTILISEKHNHMYKTEIRKFGWNYHIPIAQPLVLRILISSF